MTKFPGGQNICGASIGVLCLDSRFPKPPGHIKNPSSLPFPVLYEMIDGVTVPDLLNDPSPSLAEPFLEGARRLEREGVRAITGSCGFLELFQRELSAAVSIPVFASSLVQVPLAFQLTGGIAPVGVLTADAGALTTGHLRAVGAEDIPVAVQGMEHTSEFASVILRYERTAMDLDLVEREAVQAAQTLQRERPEIRSLALECTDLPPYAAAIQAAVKLLVFDIVTLATMVNAALTRPPYHRLMPW